MKHLLTEATNSTKKITGLNPSRSADLRELCKTAKGFKTYIRALSEGLSEKSAREFGLLAENTRMAILENSMFGTNPYETLAVPILRRFYPRLIAKDLVNTTPMDKPEVIRGFLRAYFGSSVDAAAGNYPYQFPYIAPGTRISASSDGSGTALTDISRGPSAGINAEAVTGHEEWTVDLLTLLGTTSAKSHIERDFTILGVGEDTTNILEDLTTPVMADVDGNFSFSVTYGSGATDTITGNVDYLNGILNWRSVEDNTHTLRFRCHASLEENQINAKTQFTVDKIPLRAILRQISGEWTIPFEQDMKALYSLDAQGELVGFIGEQIALEIDREIIDDLLQSNYTFNSAATHQATFDKNPDVSYTWGRKMWYENILPTMNDLSAQVYNSSLMGRANTVACNPMDAAIFESLNDFRYDGSSADGGDVGYQSASIQGGSWKILVSNVVPQGKMIITYKSDEDQRAVYFYAPYVPAILTPFPLGPKPSLTVMTRYARKCVRPEAITVLNITDTA